MTRPRLLDLFCGAGGSWAYTATEATSARTFGLRLWVSTGWLAASSRRRIPPAYTEHIGRALMEAIS